MKLTVDYREGDDAPKDDHVQGVEGNRFKSSQVKTLPKAKSQTRSKQNKDMYKFSSVYSERGVPSRL